MRARSGFESIVSISDKFCCKVNPDICQKKAQLQNMNL